MDANFAITTDNEQALELRYRPSVRLIVGLGMLGLGGLLLSQAWAGRLNAPLHAGAWRNAAIALSAAIGLFGIHALFNEKTIRADRTRQRIEINGRLLGLLSRRAMIPFREVKSVELQWHQAYGESLEHWSLILRGPGRFGGRVLDASLDERYVTRVATALSALIGCPLTRTEFTVASKQKGSPSHR